MKTLHNIFHKDLGINVIKIFIISLIALILTMSTEKLKSDNFMDLIGLIASFVAVLGPLLVFFVNTSFPQNIKWLINQHFNRSILIKFFFISQTLKIFLCLTMYGVLFVVYNYKNLKSLANSILISNQYFMYYDYFKYFMIFLCAIYVLYIFSLFRANAQDLQRLSSESKNNRRYTLLFLGIIILSLFFSIEYSVPDIIKDYCWCLFIVSTSLIVINRTFILYTARKYRFFVLVNTTIICLPLVILIFLTRNQATDTSIPVEERASGIISLGALNANFSEPQMLDFLASSSAKYYSDFLELFGDKVNFKKSLNSVTTMVHAEKFINFHSRPKEQAEVKAMVEHIDLLKNKLKLNPRFDRYSHSFFIKQKTGADFINQLIASESSYRQLAAIYFALNSFKRDEFLSFYSKYSQLINNVADGNQYIKKSINRRLNLKITLD